MARGGGFGGRSTGRVPSSLTARSPREVRIDAPSNLALADALAGRLARLMNAGGDATATAGWLSWRDSRGHLSGAELSAAADAFLSTYGP